jgi:mRNA-degrading endonuclease RelE of RelBE toxin-antitoxin system
MAWIIRLSKEAEKQFEKLPQDRQQIISQAIAGMSEDPFRGNVKPLRGKEWRGRFRKVAGRYRIIFIPYHNESIVEISGILIRSEKTYRKK